MDSSGLTESLRPAPLQLDGIVSGRDALSAKKGAQSGSSGSSSSSGADTAYESTTPPLASLCLGALLLWLMPTIYQAVASATESCLLCDIVAQVGIYMLQAVGVLGLLVAVLMHGWLRTLRTGEDCWWLRLCGQSASMQILRVLLWLVDNGPARAGPSNSWMNRAALAKSGEMRADRVEADRIVFVGSSTFTYWNQLAEDWAPLPTLNAAFGGSSTAQVNAHFSRLVKRNRPAVIVYYCGTNNLLAGLPAVSCVDGFKQFVALCREHAETRMCPIVYVGIITTPFHSMFGEVRKAAIFSANELVHKYVKSQDTTPGGTLGPLLPPEALAGVLPAPAPAAAEGAPLFPEVEAPLGAAAAATGAAAAAAAASSGGGGGGERQDGMATWHAGMVAGAMAVAESMPAPEPMPDSAAAAGAGAEAGAGAGLTLTIKNPSADSAAGGGAAAAVRSGLSPPTTTQPTRGPLFFVDVDSASFSSDLRMFHGDGHHLNNSGHTALAELLKPIVQPLWRARTAIP